MKVLIIEDEKPAAEKIKNYLDLYDNKIQVLEVISSVEKGVQWLTEYDQAIDLIIADIQLTDGTSFDIFSQVKINYPIIFTTAYDEYAIKAFELNSIDYLLKPLSFESFFKSMDKIEKLRESLSANKQKIQIEQLTETLSLFQKSYKTRFMVKVGERIRSFTTEKIALFYADGRTVYLVTNEHKEYIVDYRLEELIDIIDPAMFFRIGRSFIVNIQAIRDVVVYSNSRLKIRLNTDFDKELIVSRDKVASFKEWFSGNMD